MKCQILISGENISLSSAENAQREVKVKGVFDHTLLKKNSRPRLLSQMGVLIPAWSGNILLWK